MFEWLQNKWLQSDLAGWLTVVFTLVLGVLAWRALRPAGYIEFHDNWKAEIKDKKVIVTGHISKDTPSGRLWGRGSLKLNGAKIPLMLKSINQHMVYQAFACVFEGEYDKEVLEEHSGTLKLKIRLGDGTTKNFKTQIQFAKEAIS